MPTLPGKSTGSSNLITSRHSGADLKNSSENFLTKSVEFQHPPSPNPSSANSPQSPKYGKIEPANSAASSPTSPSVENGSRMNMPGEFVENDSGRKLAHRERRFRRLFRNVPTTENLLCRYSCAYVSDLGLLLQGHLYVSNNWICFHSNVFGIEKIIEVQADSVISVSKAHTAKIIPNAVKVITDVKTYLFGSLVSRDNTYRLLTNIISNGQLRNSKLVKSDFADTSMRNPLKSVDYDDDCSTVSGLTSNSSSSSLMTQDNLSKSDASVIRRTSTPAVLAISGIVEEPEPVIWRRFFQSGGGGNRVTMQIGDPGVGQSGNGVKGERDLKSVLRKPTSMNSVFPAILTWFFGLPRMLMLLIICVILVMFLFLCASILTIRLLYLRNPTSGFIEYRQWNLESETDDVLLNFQALEKMATILEHSLKSIDLVQNYLENLKMELKNGITEAALTLSTVGTEEKF